MRTFRTFLLGTSLVVLPLGAIHAQTPPPAVPASASAAPAKTASAAPTSAPSASAAPSVSASVSASTSAAPAPAGKLPPLATDDAVAGGIGLASVVVGAVLMGVATGIHGSVASAAPKDVRGDPVCGARPDADAIPKPDNGQCADLRKQANLGTDIGNAGITLMVTGGLLAGAATAYWLLSKPSPAPGPRSAKSAPGPTVRVAPAVGTAGGGLIVVGSF